MGAPEGQARFAWLGPVSRHPIVSGVASAAVIAVLAGLWGAVRSGAERVVSGDESPLAATVTYQPGPYFSVGLALSEPPMPDLADRASLGGVGIARRHGGGEATSVFRRMVLTGRKGTSVVTNLRARVVERHEPPTLLVSFTALAHTDRVQYAEIDLDSEEPIAVVRGDDVEPARVGKPFFEGVTLTLPPGESDTIDLWVVGDRCDCSFELLLDVVADGTPRTIAVRDHDGELFRMTTRPDAAAAWQSARCGLERQRTATPVCLAL